MDEKSKPWYFDPQTERTAALAGNPQADYLLLDATPEDTQKTISFYQNGPVPGYEVARVEVIYNRDFNLDFNSQLKRLQKRKGKAAFAPKWSSMSNVDLRQRTMELLDNISQNHVDSDYPDVKLIPGWHGTKPEVLESIFTIGYANLATTDSGFFGKGLYSAYEAEYAYRVYYKGALILNWVALFSALPVVDGDMPMLSGKGNYGAYDAHFVPVVPANPKNPNEVNYFPWKSGQTNKYTEIVTFQPVACLPRFLVTLQPTLPKALAQAPIPIGTPQNFFQALKNNLASPEGLTKKMDLAKTLYSEGYYRKSFALWMQVISETKDNDQKGVSYAYSADILRLLDKLEEAEKSISLAVRFVSENADYAKLKTLILAIQNSGGMLDSAEPFFENTIKATNNLNI
jgi:hypothetical protein